MDIKHGLFHKLEKLRKDLAEAFNNSKNSNVRMNALIDDCKARMKHGAACYAQMLKELTYENQNDPRRLQSMLYYIEEGKELNRVKSLSEKHMSIPRTSIEFLERVLCDLDEMVPKLEKGDESAGSLQTAFVSCFHASHSVNYIIDTSMFRLNESIVGKESVTKNKTVYERAKEMKPLIDDYLNRLTILKGKKYVPNE